MNKKICQKWFSLKYFGKTIDEVMIMEKKVPSIENGTMAGNFDEVKELGKQMERMRDGLELAEDDRITDPIQVDEPEDNIKKQ